MIDGPCFLKDLSGSISIPFHPVVKGGEGEKLVHQKVCIGGEINEIKKYFLEPFESLEESE